MIFTIDYTNEVNKVSSELQTYHKMFFKLYNRYLKVKDNGKKKRIMIHTLKTYNKWILKKQTQLDKLTMLGDVIKQYIHNKEEI